MEEEIKILTKILKKYVDIKLFSQSQEMFKKEFFDALFEPYEPVDYSKRTVGLINAILEEDNLPYLFYSDIDESSNQSYWMLIDLNKIE